MEQESRFEGIRDAEARERDRVEAAQDRRIAHDLHEHQKWGADALGEQPGDPDLEDRDRTEYLNLQRRQYERRQRQKWG